jgi:hypothetical protein
MIGVGVGVGGGVLALVCVVVTAVVLFTRGTPDTSSTAVSASPARGHTYTVPDSLADKVDWSPFHTYGASKGYQVNNDMDNGTCTQLAYSSRFGGSDFVEVTADVCPTVEVADKLYDARHREVTVNGVAKDVSVGQKAFENRRNVSTGYENQLHLDLYALEGNLVLGYTTELFHDNHQAWSDSQTDTVFEQITTSARDTLNNLR